MGSGQACRPATGDLLLAVPACPLAAIGDGEPRSFRRLSPPHPRIAAKLDLAPYRSR